MINGTKADDASFKKAHLLPSSYPEEKSLNGSTIRTFLDRTPPWSHPMQVAVLQLLHEDTDNPIWEIQTHLNDH